MLGAMSFHMGDALDPYPTCADDFACNPECSDLCRDRTDASDTSPNCWGTDIWMCGPMEPESTRGDPSCTYAWYTTGEVWGTQYPIIDADRLRVFCTNLCPAGYYILSPNLADGEVPDTDPAILQQEIVAQQSRRLEALPGSELFSEEEMPGDLENLQNLQQLLGRLEEETLLHALEVAHVSIDSLRRKLDDSCDRETSNVCGQEYLAMSTAEKLGDCQTIWDLYFCLINLECSEPYAETIHDTQLLINSSGCGNFSYQPRDDCDEEAAQDCIDDLDAETCTGISSFRDCMAAVGCITEEESDSDFDALLETLDYLDDQCEFECRGCDEGCRSALWCLDYYGCAKCNASASLWISDGPPYTCLAACPSGFADEAGVCTQCIGVVEDGICNPLSNAKGFHLSAFVAILLVTVAIY